MFVMCAGNELFYSFLYLLHFTYGPLLFGMSLLKLLVIVLLPVAVLKFVLALMQGVSAWKHLGGIDISERLSAASATKKE